LTPCRLTRCALSRPTSAADAALYRAKRGGRNRVALTDEVEKIG
jgi:hypothetical protein